MRLAHLLLIVCGAMLVMPLHALARETVLSIAPFTVDTHDSDAPEPELLQAMLLSCLSDEPAFAVVERVDLALAVSQTEKANPGLVTPKRKDMPRYTVADYVITGNVSSLEGKWLVSMQMNNPATTQMVAATAATISARYDTKELCAHAVNPLLRKFAKTKPADIASIPSEGADSEAEANLLAHGISASENGHYAKAFPYFLKILANNPSHADARYWLAISYAKAGLTDFAREEAKACFEQFPAHAKRGELEALITKTNNTGE